MHAIDLNDFSSVRVGIMQLKYLIQMVPDSARPTVFFKWYSVFITPVSDAGVVLAIKNHVNVVINVM